MKDYDNITSDKNLYSLISQGEHENQDFKYKISSARKIARTLSAFSNTTGGTLLVGIRDNGSLGGVKDEDDIYLLESASQIFLEPKIELEVLAHQVEGKTIWEINIEEGKNKPYRVEEDGNWTAYYRQDDKNIAANAVMLEIWRQDQLNESKHPVAFTEKERKLIDYLNTYGSISISKAAKVMELPRNKVIVNFARLIRWEVLAWNIEDGQYSYYLD